MGKDCHNCQMLNFCPKYCILVHLKNNDIFWLTRRLLVARDFNLPIVPVANMCAMEVQRVIML